ncbi:hypothetical protein BH24ACT15_BH24ACT15_30410 [soil metagenome]
MTEHVARKPVSRATYCDGCRCDACRATNRDYQRSLTNKLKSRERDAEGHPIGQPYSASTYKNYACRCDACSTVEAALWAVYAAGRRASKAEATS